MNSTKKRGRVNVPDDNFVYFVGCEIVVILYCNRVVVFVYKYDKCERTLYIESYYRHIDEITIVPH